MPLALISGPINSGKTKHMLEALDAAKPGVTGMLIVPDTFTASELKRRFLAKNKISALKGDAIMDWHGFVRKYANVKYPLLSRKQVTLAICDLLSKTQLTYFGRAQKSFGLASQFTSAVLTLKSNCVKPARLEQIIESNRRAAKREADLLKIYRAYERLLSELLVFDEGDLTSFALKSISDKSKALPLENAALLFDEFTSFTPGQTALISAIKDAFPKTDIRISFSSPQENEPERDLYSNYLSRGLGAVRKMADREIKLTPPCGRKPKAQIFVASSPAQEAREVARMLGDALKHGVCASDIVVASRQDSSFMEWFLSEAHSMELLSEHPTLDSAYASPFIHKLLSYESVEALPKSASVDEYVSRMEALANVPVQTGSWTAKMKGLRGRGRVAARSLTSAVQFMEALNNLEVSARLLGIKRINREDFIKSLSHALKAGTSPATLLDAVLPFRNAPLGTLLASAAKEVIVPGAIEGNLPCIGADAPFFADWEDETIRACFPSIEDIHAREAYAFETLCEKCTERISFVMPAVNDQGSETLRSPFVERFIDEETKPVPLIPRPLSPISVGTADLRVEIENERRSSIDPLKSKHPSHLGLLTDPNAKRIVRERFTENEVSTTALERYANCPFSFFARYVLGIDELLEEDPEIRPLDRGNIVHEILKRFYKEYNDEAISARHDERIALKVANTVKKLSQEVWKDSSRAVERVSPGLRERERVDMEIMALQVVRAEIYEARHIKSPLRPKECEWTFGNDQGTALFIPVDGEPPAAIRGRVDRIDIGDDGKRFLVIDYKTGKAKPIVNSIHNGLHLQLPLYIAAVKANLFPDAFALGGLVIDVKAASASESVKKTEGKTQGIVRKEFEGSCFRVGGAKSKVDDDAFEEAMEQATAHAARYIKSIRAGEFFARRDAVCDYCDNGDTCRYKKMASD